MVLTLVYFKWAITFETYSTLFTKERLWEVRYKLIIRPMQDPTNYLLAQLQAIHIWPSLTWDWRIVPIQLLDWCKTWEMDLVDALEPSKHCFIQLKLKNQYKIRVGNPDEWCIQNCLPQDCLPVGNPKVWGRQSEVSPVVPPRIVSEVVIVAEQRSGTELSSGGIGVHCPCASSGFPASASSASQKSHQLQLIPSHLKVNRWIITAGIQFA